MTSLNKRRAIFVYEGARLAAQAAGAPIIPASWNEREQAFREQFLAVNLFGSSWHGGRPIKSNIQASLNTVPCIIIRRHTHQLIQFKSNKTMS